MFQATAPTVRCPFALSTVVVLILLYASVAMAQEPFVIAIGEWPPYFSESLKHGGVGTRICEQAFARENRRVQFKFLPWKRSLDFARSGQFTGTLGWRKTSGREKSFLFSDPVFSEEDVVFHRTDTNLDWKTLNDLGPFKIGVTRGYIYEKMLGRTVQRHGGKLEFASSDALNFKMLAQGRTDIFPCSRTVGNYLLKTALAPELARTITYHPRVIASGDFFLLISKTIPEGQEIIRQFNAGLRKLRESGEYDRFFLGDAAPPTP